MTQIADALRIAGLESQDDWVDDIAYNGGGTGLPDDPDRYRIQSHALKQPLASPDLYVGAWLLFTEREHHNRERVIEEYDPETGTAWFTTFPFAGVPFVETDEHFQVWSRFRPTDVERTLLLALRSMHQIRIDYLTGVTIGGLRQIDLTAALPWITSSNQVIGIGTHDEPIPRAEASYAGGVFVRMSGGLDAAPHVSLSVQGVAPYTTRDTLVVYSWANWDDSTSDFAFGLGLADGVTQVAPEWWAWEALYRLSRQTQYRDPDLETRAIGELNRLRPMFAPEQSYRAFEPQEFYGPSGVMGY